MVSNLQDFNNDTPRVSDLSKSSKEYKQRLNEWAELYKHQYLEYIQSNYIEIVNACLKHQDDTVVVVYCETSLSCCLESEHTYIKTTRWGCKIVSAESYKVLFPEHKLESFFTKQSIVFCCIENNGGTFCTINNNTYIDDITYSWLFSIPLTDDAVDVKKERQNRGKRVAKPNKQNEKHLEDELYDWLRLQGVNVERQVSTSKHRLDLWIPGKMMIELKQGRVTGDDVCQAIDYAGNYQTLIVLVGSGLSTSASRGIEGFNIAVNKDRIIFMTWGGIKSFLQAKLMLNGI